MAAITNYTDLISLAQVKEYLRLDDQGTTLDAELTQMINGACRYVEIYSNHYLKPTEKEYSYRLCGINIYDFPINSITDPADAEDYTRRKRNYYETIEITNLTLAVEDTTVKANIGYTDTEDVDPLLVSAVLEQIRQWFYNAEGSLTVGSMNPNVKQMLDPIKRFIV